LSEKGKGKNSVSFGLLVPFSVPGEKKKKGKEKKSLHPA